ncbi:MULTISPECIES: ATP-binding protein [unclassified Carboxylicivirga]|uniref:sensor histidine kinase n=1 Tax=Carboxylicivirga TaxID=1628153 RepID=UPI003D3291E6
MTLRHKQAIATILTLFLLPFSTLMRAEKLTELVVLHSYHNNFQWTADINQQIRQYYHADESVRLFCEFMDSKRFHSDAYFQTLYEQYYLKYHNHPIDGVICSDNRAFDFFMQHGQEIWGDVPAVFCGINSPSNNQLHPIDSSKNIIIHERIDIGGTLSMIEQLQPNLEELIVISDNTLSGKIFLSQFKDAFNNITRNYGYRIIDNTQPDTLRKTLNELPTQRRAIYLLSLYTHRAGIPHEMMRESQFFFKNIDIPIYSNWDFLMPKLIVGGKILTGADQGRMAAVAMDSILRKQNSEPHLHAASSAIVDAMQLNRHRLNTDNLTTDHRVINRPKTFVERHRSELIIIFTILIIFTFIIIQLVSVIIKRKRVEISFIESESRLELAISGANEGLWDIDFSHKNIFVNEQFAHLNGYRSTKDLQITLHNWESHVVKQDLPQMKEAFYLHQSGKTDAFQCEARLIDKNGSSSWFLIHGKIMETLNGKPNRVTGIILNINSQKAFEQELQKAKEKAEESDRLKSSFLANMSHEIRTPMNAILGFTDLMMCGKLNTGDQHSYLSVIKQSGENLLGLINDIIDISKIESGQLKINTGRVDIGSLVEEVHSMGSSLCASLKKKISIRVNHNPKVPAVYTDRLRIYQILLNLVSNAVKFTEQGQVTINYALEENNIMVLKVEDTGPGISQKDQKVIFDRFRQGDESSNKKHGGTGLGLSISKSLAELMCGSIELISQPGNGALFIVKIPVKTQVLSPSANDTTCT